MSPNVFDQFDHHLMMIKLIENVLTAFTLKTYILLLLAKYTYIYLFDQYFTAVS